MFSKRNPETACKMWSLTYIIALSIVIILIVTFLFLSRKMKHKNVKKVLLGMAIFASTTEIIKMIFTGVQYGIKEVEFTPLYFCSLFIYMTIFAVTKNETLQTTGLSFIFFGGIIGATAFFIYPNSCIPNYPIYHFMCLRTMLYHGAMIYTGLLVVITGYYKPSIKHFKHYVIALSIICILAYIMNISFGYDFMYIQKPLAFKISQDVYNSIPKLYPFIIMILEILVPFFTSFGIYQLSKLVFKNKKETI